MKNMIKKVGAGLATFGAMAASQVHAAIDVTEVGTSITNAETAAHGIGTQVIAVVAGLVVVGIVIGLVRKL